MSDKLIVNGVQLDLIKEQPISITYSQAGISDPKKRVRSFSKSFKLAGTQNNKKFFKEFLMLTWVRNDNIITDVTFNPSTNLPCKLYKNEQLRFEGFLKLTDILINKSVFFFEVNMYSDVANMFQQWDDMLISDLDWSKYNHLMNEDTIVKSYNGTIRVNGVDTSNFSGNNPNGFGYLYGIVDYGLNANQTDYLDSNLFPLLYYREIFLKSFELLGYTVNSGFIDSQDFKDLLFGWGGGESVSLSDTLISNLEIDASFFASFSETKTSQLITDTIYGGTFVNNLSIYKVLNLLDSESSFSEVINIDALSQLSNGLITIGATATYKISLSFDAIVTNTISTDAITNGSYYEGRLIMIKNNGSILLDTYRHNGVTAPLNWSNNIEIEYNLSTNDDVYFQFEVSSFSGTYGSGTFANLTTALDLNNTFTLNIECISSGVVTNSDVYLSNYVPKMKVVDFIKSAITHFNLYLSDPDVNNVIDIEPMPLYYTDSTNNDDWTHKQDLSKQIKITPIATKQPTQLNFKFKHDKDFYSDDYYNSIGKYYGDYEHNNDLSYGTSKQSYQLPYALTPLVQLDNGLIIPRIVKIENGVVKPFKGSPRLYQFGGLKAGNFNILDFGGTPILQTEYPVLSNLNDLDNPTKDLCFATPEMVYYDTSNYTTNTAFKQFYSLMINELSNIDSKLLTSYYRLNQNDVKRGFMRRLKMLNGVLYRFNLLTDYNINSDESYVAELIKVLDVKSVGSALVPYNPPLSKVDVTNGNKVIEVDKSVTVEGDQKLIIIDSTAKEDVSLDLTKIPIGKEFTIFNKSNKNVTITSLDGDTINGLGEKVLGQVNSYAKLIYTGTEYLIISE